MDKIVEEQIRAWAKREFLYQAAIAFFAVVLVVSFMTRHFKTILDALPSIRKFFAYAHKKWFSQAIFRADVLRFMNHFQLKLNEIEKEVKHNGGGSLKDVVRRLEDGQTLVMTEVRYLSELRKISDKFDDKMNFRYDPEQGVTFISESFLTAFGCSDDDVLYYNFAELLHPEDRTEMWARWQLSCEKKVQFRQLQRIKGLTGDYVKCEVKAIPVIIDGTIKEFKGVIEIV